MIRAIPLLLALLAVPAARAQLPLLHTLASPSPEDSGLFGYAVAAVPDLDGDQFSDLLVGAPSEPNGPLATAGWTYAFSSATGALLDAIPSPEPTAAGQFGHAVAGLPDRNGDGRGEYLVAAPSDGPTGDGRVYLIAGITGDLLSSFASPNAEASGAFGQAVALVPDADGDSVPDLLVGASYEDGGATDGGRAYLFSGATGALLHALARPAPEEGASFGHAVAGVPDADGDGRGDLLVGAPLEDDVWDNAGRAYLFSGATGALLHTFDPPNQANINVNFGLAVAGVPDLDGDGRGDLVVSLPGPAAGGGQVRVYTGATGELLHTIDVEFGQGGGGFGIALASLPDLSGDGVPDLLIGATFENSGILYSGRVHLHSGATGERLLVFHSPNFEGQGRFGTAVAAVPDADGDGYADLLVGAHQEDGGATNAGRAYLFSTSTLVAAEAGPNPPSLALSAAWPNPSSGRAALSFALAEPGPVLLRLYDALGREVAVLADGAHAAGRHEVVLDASRLPPGVYVVRLTAGEAAAVQRLVVAR